VSHILPVPFSFCEPVDGPALGVLEDPTAGAGGSFGMTICSSTPESTVEMVISPGSGTGVRLGLSIAQFSAILTYSSVSGRSGCYMKSKWEKMRVEREEDAVGLAGSGRCNHCCEHSHALGPHTAKISGIIDSSRLMGTRLAPISSPRRPSIPALSVNGGRILLGWSREIHCSRLSDIQKRKLAYGYLAQW